MNAKVFINYRREDTAPYAGRVYDRLTAHFGEDQVFIDIDQIEPGEDFVEAINRKVSACDIAIVAIGPDWLHATDASGKRRLDDEEDFVRMEIVAALQRKIRVIPVLVGGAQMPRKQDLPEALAPLSRRNAIELSETRFHADVNRLIEAIEKSFVVVEKKTELSASPASTQTTTPVKPTQTTPTTPPVPSTSSIAILKESAVWPRKRLVMIGAVGAAVILLPLAAFLLWPRDQKGGSGSNPSTVANPEKLVANPERVVANPQRVTPSPATSSTPAEAQSTDQGNYATNFEIGRRYEKGEGVPQDYRKAAEFFQKAADQGNAEAQDNLGWLYEHGRGVPQDYRKAAEFFQKAADQGSEAAIANLKKLSGLRK